MDALVLLLLLLACPVSMGVATWLGTRRGQQPSGTSLPDASVLPARPGLQQQQATQPDGAAQARPSHLLCVDWRIVGAVALAAVLLWRLAPQLVLPAVILLLVLACPISHYLLMRGGLMRAGPGTSCHSTPQQPSGAQARTPPSGQGE